MNKNKLEKQLNNFIKSGFKLSKFTDDLYNMLYIETNVFIAHFDKRGFHSVRFDCNAEDTITMLESVKKPEIKNLCLELAKAMKKSMYERIETKQSFSVVKGA